MKTIQHSIVHRVQFSETDMAGVVHFSSFFKWMEEVEHAFFRSVGLSVAMQHEGMHVGWPRVNASCNYTRSARFEEEVECRLTVTRIGGKSFSYEVDFFVGGEAIAKGSVTSVCCAMVGGEMRGIVIPEGIRGKLEG